MNSINPVSCFSLLPCCVHNDRPGVSVMDGVEHAGNLEVGTALRDLADVSSGYEDWAGFNQAPPLDDDSGTTEPTRNK